MSISESLKSIKGKVKGIKDNVLAAYEIIENAGFDTKNKKVEELPSVVSKAINKATMISRGGELGNRTLFIDFDGTPLFAYEPEEILALEELPIPYTSHERLTFVKWNYTLEQIKEEVTTSGWVDVGALYVPTDGWGEMEIEIDGTIPQFTPHFRMWTESVGVLTIDWGDGTVDTYEDKDNDVKHTYTEKGKYLVRFISSTPYYGLYAYNDTKALVVGRFVFPTNSRFVGYSHIKGQAGGNNPVENNTDYSSPQCLAHTLVETIVIPPGCSIGAGNHGSGLTTMNALKSIVCENEGSQVWRAPDLKFPSVRFFSIPLEIIHFTDLTTSPFVGARSMKLTYSRLGKHNEQIRYSNLERLRIPKSLGLSVTQPVYLPLIRSLDGYKWRSYDMFWTTGGLINMRYCDYFPKPEEEGKIAYFSSLNENIAIKDYGQIFTVGSGNYFPTFSSNTSLQTISLLGSNTTVRTIKASSFSNDYCLREVHLIYREPTETSALIALASVNAFTGCPSDMKIYVPPVLVDRYKTATNWSTYADQIFAEPEVEPTE